MTYYELYSKMFDYAKDLGFPIWELDCQDALFQFMEENYLFADGEVYYKN